MNKRVTSRDVDCPTCGAPKGERCHGSVTGSSRGRPVDYHYDRRQVARAEITHTKDAGEREWKPGDSPVLPPLPDSAYPPDAVELPAGDTHA